MSECTPAVPQSFTTMGDVSTATWNGLVDRFSPSGVQTTAKQSFTSAAPAAGSQADQERPQSLIGFVNNGSQLADGNVWAILWLLAALSLVLAVFNLLPVPRLDGGHAVVAVYEGCVEGQHHRVVVDYRKVIPISAVVVLAPLLILAPLGDGARRASAPAVERRTALLGWPQAQRQR